MPSIDAATTLSIIQTINLHTGLVSAVSKIYHHYHIDLALLIITPLSLVITGIVCWRWQKQRSLIALLDEAAMVDHTTQMKNRKGISHELIKELARAQRYKTDTSVLMIDIDHFKTINELYGNKVGDRVIVHIGKTIRESLRLSDSVGRFGGEEFMAILTDTSVDDATLVAERIRKIILDKPLMDDAEPVIVSVSIGVATHNNDTESPYQLIHHSDQALHYAKHSGRNQVQSWALH